MPLLLGAFIFSILFLVAVVFFRPGMLITRTSLSHFDVARESESEPDATFELLTALRTQMVRILGDIHLWSLT